MRQFLENQTGLSIYPMLSLVIFLIFFTGVLMWALLVDKRYLDAMGQMPLDTSDTTEAIDMQHSSIISKANKI